MLQDLRFALRTLRKTPGFTFIAALALALGIGANAAFFSVINSIFLRPLPYPEPDRLVRLSSTVPDSPLTRVGFSSTRLAVIREQQQVFTDLAMAAPALFVVSDREEARQFTGAFASANYLSVLGVPVQLGRFFSAEEDRRGGPDVVVLSDNYWRNHLAADPAVLGRVLKIDGRPHTVIGVLPASLSRFPFQQRDLWVPRPIEVPYFVPAQIENGVFGFEVIARLRPGVTLASAREQVGLLAAGYGAANPKNVDAKSIAEVNELLEDNVGDQRRGYLMLFGAVGCVLLIACANVANLLLARFAGRRKEIALRFALGAGRGAVIRQLLAESLLLAGMGGAAGVLFAHWALDLLVASAAELLPRAAEITLDGRALAFTLLVALATGLVMGLVPAWQAAGADVNDALKESSRGSTGSRAQHTFRSGLFVAEVALSLVLLIAAGLLLTSFTRLQRVSAGFNPEGVFVANVVIPPAKYPDNPRLAALYQRLYTRMNAIPGVASAALTDRVPLTGVASTAPVAVSGRPILPMGQRDTAMRNLVSPGLFRTLGMQLKRGRDFDERDNPQSPQVVIINEAFARKHFPGEDPLGRIIITGMGQRPAEIIGIVSDVRGTNLQTAPEPDYYLPSLQRPESFAAILLRVQGGDPAGFAGAVRAALKEIDPDLPLIQPQTLTDRVAQTVADRRFALVLLGSFAALALLLACIGVYSVMACIVSQRTNEIGIRMALGADRATVLRLVLGQGLRLTGLGVVLGLGAAFALTRLMQQVLFEVQAHDPLIYGALATVLATVAAFACWLPALKATRVNPIIALRTE